MKRDRKREYIQHVVKVLLTLNATYNFPDNFRILLPPPQLAKHRFINTIKIVAMNIYMIYNIITSKRSERPLNVARLC